ncbi:MAG: aminotransferase class V-fold PLP-dependent enzyme, partial [Cyanobacteria bacterium P01_C01_bin.70]
GGAGAPPGGGGPPAGARRSGTLYTPQIVGLGKALALAWESQTSEQKTLRQLRDRLWHSLKNIPDLYLNGHPTQRLANNLNISVAGLDGQALVLGLKHTVALSSGAACSSASTTPSHVLKALGHSDELAYASLRFGIGRFNTAADIDQVARACHETIKGLRRSPVPAPSVN